MGRSRGSRKGRLFNLFKTAFTISFFHKPSGLIGDIYYYFVLNDSVRLRILLADNYLVINGVTPLTMTNLDKLYGRLIQFLQNQTEFTVVIDASGDVSPITQTAIKLDLPLVENDSLSIMNSSLYGEYQTYCKNDLSKCGLYLVAVNDDKLAKEEPEEEPEPEVEEEKPVIVITPEEEPDEEEGDPEELAQSEYNMRQFTDHYLGDCLVTMSQVASGEDTSTQWVNLMITTPLHTIKFNLYFDNVIQALYVHHCTMSEFDYSDCKSFINLLIRVAEWKDVYIVGVGVNDSIDAQLFRSMDGTKLEQWHFSRVEFPKYLLTLVTGKIYRVKTDATQV